MADYIHRPTGVVVRDADLGREIAPCERLDEQRIGWAEAKGNSRHAWHQFAEAFRELDDAHADEPTITIEPLTHDRRWCRFLATGGSAVRELVFDRSWWTGMEIPDKLTLNGHTFALELPAITERGVRVSAGQVWGVQRKMGLPASRSLPRRKTSEGTPENMYGHSVFRYKDGGYSDDHGRPIVAGRADEERENARTGTINERRL